MTAGWPLDLGPDPAPGDADGLRLAALRAGGTARQLSDSAAALRTVAADDGLWTGSAALAFRARLGALPVELAQAGSALADVERALLSYVATLVDAQARARSLVAQWQAGTASPAGAPTGAPVADLGELLVRADDLAAQVALAARRAEAVVRHAAASAPRQPAWFLQLARSVDEAVSQFVREHAAAIKLALDVLTLVQAGLLVVGAAPAVPFLIAASLGATLLLYRYDQASTGDVAATFAGAFVGPAAKVVMSERVVSTAVGLAPRAARSTVELGVRTGQPVASSTLRALDVQLTAGGVVTASDDVARAAVRLGEHERSGQRSTCRSGRPR